MATIQGLLMARVLDEADVCAHPARGQLHAHQVGRAPGQLLNRSCVSTVDPQTQVALQPQPISPSPATGKGPISAGVP